MYDRSTVYPSILERMRNGESLRSICLDESMPHIDTVMDWLNDDQPFSVQYTRAGEIRGDYFVDRAVQAIEIVPPMVGDTNHKAGETRMDSAHVAWQKAQADTYLKVAALVAPKKYGAKMDLNHGGQKDNPISSITRTIIDPQSGHQDS